MLYNPYNGVFKLIFERKIEVEHCDNYAEFALSEWVCKSSLLCAS